MTPHLIIFLVAVAYLSWLLYRYVQGRKNPRGPFIEVIDDTPAQPPPPPRPKKREKEDDHEWRKRVRAEIEDMTR